MADVVQCLKERSLLVDPRNLRQLSGRRQSDGVERKSFFWRLNVERIEISRKKISTILRETALKSIPSSIFGTHSSVSQLLPSLHRPINHRVTPMSVMFGHAPVDEEGMKAIDAASIDRRKEENSQTKIIIEIVIRMSCLQRSESAFREFVVLINRYVM